jgi:DNA-directed RNA polymerase sigma subunit (sigma70/sigma32)
LDHGIESCALDVANQGRHTSVELAKLLGVTRQRVEYIEKQAIERARKRGLPGV